MDKSWIQLPRGSNEYTKGIKEFIELARRNADTKKRTRCPCRKCNNRYFYTVDEVYKHLRLSGMDKSYTNWVHHGENIEIAVDSSTDDDDNDYNGDGELTGLQDLIADLQGPIRMDNNNPVNTDTTNGEEEALDDHDPNVSDGTSEFFGRLLSEAQQPVYPGCKFSKLEFLVKLLHLKIINHWSNKSFDMTLQLIKALLPPSETLPKSHYEVKSFMRNLGLGYISIHACINDCVLFWKEKENLENCPECGEPRFMVSKSKGKKIPQKVLRHFPLKPRLQRLFMSRLTATDMRWHHEKREREENVLRHPADSQVWEDFDKEYKWFAEDARNVRLGIASDGFNPFDMTNPYSMWPVMVIPYNLPPWKCMKESFLFMSLLIPGPRAPGNDIDVYLQPLIDELKDLWDNGVETYDAVTKKEFRLHAAVLWTINDFPAYANLSGWSTKGKLACPTCNKDTCSTYLKNGRKLCYMDHRRFLPPRHRWRNRDVDLFDGKIERRQAPEMMSGNDVLSQLEHITTRKFGKSSTNPKSKRSESELNWTKRSIFFDLPYWSSIKLRNNLDVMHIEKNICENVLGTLLNIDGKTKDTIKARLDLAEMGIKEKLHLVPKGNKFTIPHACYTFTPLERKKFSEWVKTVKFPDGYASNISRCVNAKDGKMSGMKSHDCHVFLQRLLPVAMRGFLAHDVSTPLIELGIFFKELCCKTLKLDALGKMKGGIIQILCKLEQIYPPAFFDVMVHLAVHLPHEAILGGPVQYRWMYPIERFLRTLKKYVRNKARPEASIAEAYVDSECLTFCSMYLQGIETRFNREDRNYDGGHREQNGFQVFTQNVRVLGGFKLITLEPKDFDKACYYVLHNTDEIRPYFEEHIIELRKQSSRNLDKTQEKYFAKWFEQKMQVLRNNGSAEATNDLFSLASGPDRRVKRYSGCVVNGIRFHTIDREANLRTQNSGVVVKGDHQSKEIDFYGILTDIIELDYVYGKRVFLFKCDWWDVGNRKLGIQTDSHFTSVNTARKWYKDDQFVLATQAEQVFYLDDTKLNGAWKIVQKLKPRNVYDVREVDEETGGDDNDAYQQEEQLGRNIMVHEVDQEHGDGDQNVETTPIQLNREDVNPEEIDADVVVVNEERNTIEDSLTIDGDLYEEDETLAEYYSTEEEEEEGGGEGEGEVIFLSDDEANSDF